MWNSGGYVFLKWTIPLGNAWGREGFEVRKSKRCVFLHLGIVVQSATPLIMPYSDPKH